MTRFELALGLVVAAFVPVLAALPPNGLASTASFAPFLDPFIGLSSSAVFVGALLFVAALPRAVDVDRSAPHAVACVLSFAPLGAWCVARDGAALEVALALVLGALAAWARARTRAPVWSLVWWLVFGLPPLVYVAVGRAGDDFAAAARVLALSPFELVRSASGAADHAWWGSAVLCAAALAAVLFAPAPRADRDQAKESPA
jgi:hypothetical protein